MSESLTKQDKVFVKELVEHGNQTEASKKAYNYTNSAVAAVMANKRLKKVKIQRAIKTLAERIPDDKLEEVLKDGLEAVRSVPEVGYEADYNVRHKYLDTAIKLKGLYAPEKSVNLNLNLDDEETKEKINKLNDRFNEFIKQEHS